MRKSILFFCLTLVLVAAPAFGAEKTPAKNNNVNAEAKANVTNLGTNSNQESAIVKVIKCGKTNGYSIYSPDRKFVEDSVSLSNYIFFFDKNGYITVGLENGLDHMGFPQNRKTIVTNIVTNTENNALFNLQDKASARMEVFSLLMTPDKIFFTNFMIQEDPDNRVEYRRSSMFTGECKRMK